MLILQRIDKGDMQAADRLLPLVYGAIDKTHRLFTDVRLVVCPMSLSTHCTARSLPSIASTK
jgi:hypothetical protein